MDYASIVAIVSGLPVIGKWALLALSFLAPLVMLCTALMAFFHALVQVCQALALFPLFAKLQGLADALKKDDEAVSGFWATKVKPLLDRFSIIPMPKV